MSEMERFYDLRQVAEITAFSVLTLRRFIKTGDLKPERWGREFRVSSAELRRFVESRRTQPVPESSRPGHWSGKNDENNGSSNDDLRSSPDDQ